MSVPFVDSTRSNLKPILCYKCNIRSTTLLYVIQALTLIVVKHAKEKCKVYTYWNHVPVMHTDADDASTLG